MAESKRLTRGSAAKMREERRSEHLEDPIGVQNLPQIQNGNVESSSARGDLEKDDEDRIVVEEETAFACKDLPKDAPHIHCFVNHDIKTQLTKHLTEQQYNLFCEKTCFGHYMRMRICVGQGQILRCCMALELECSTRQALVIRVNGTILKFTLRTFALITGLNCVGVIDDFKFNTKEPNRLIVQYFGGNEFIRKSDLMGRFTKKVWADNEDDALKFAILYFIHTYVYSGERTSKRIPRIHFDLVESGRYMQYPWGRKAFHWLLKSINKKLTSHGQFYRICGMPIVLQIWIYECSGKVNMKFAQKINDRIPRILNWQTVGANPRYKKLMRDTFNDGNVEIKWKNIVPSARELTVLQLPPEGVENMNQGVQSESSDDDSNGSSFSGQNSDDDFQDEPPPSYKVKGKRKKGKPVSTVKKKRKQQPTVEDQIAWNQQPDPVLKQAAKKVGCPKVVRKNPKVGIKNTTTHTSFPMMESEIPYASVSQQQLLRKELSELRNEFREEFKDIRKMIKDNFNLLMSALKNKQSAKMDNLNDEDDGQIPPPFTSPELSGKQHQGQFDEENTQTYGSSKYVSVDDKKTDDISVSVMKADKQGVFVNSPVRNLINIDDVASASRTVVPRIQIPQPTFEFDIPTTTIPLIFEEPHEVRNEDKDQFLPPAPLQSMDPMDVPTESQFELDDHLMSSLSNIKSTSVPETTIIPHQSINVIYQTTSEGKTNMQEQTSMKDQTKISHDQTPLPMHRIRRPGPFNTSPYLTTFGSSAGSSSMQPLIFELNHPFIFDLISGNHDITLLDAYRSWVQQGLLAKHENKQHDQNRYKKNKEDIPVPMNFGVDLIDNKNWFYKLSFKGQLLSDSHINVIFYYLRKKAKYEVTSRYKYTTVDCVFTSKISSIWEKYADLDSDVCCVDEEHIIGEYITGYKVHAGIPWHLVDHIFVPVHVNDKFHWVLAVVSLNDKRINVYDSYRAAGHNAAIMCEVKKLAQLIPLKLAMTDYYKNRGVDISLSQEENESFDIVFIENIPQQEHGSLDCGIYMLAYAEWLSYGQENMVGKFDVMFLRSRYAALLWNYGQWKNDAGAISDSEAPPRHNRSQIVRDDRETIEIH